MNKVSHVIAVAGTPCQDLSEGAARWAQGQQKQLVFRAGKQERYCKLTIANKIAHLACNFFEYTFLVVFDKMFEACRVLYKKAQTSTDA